MFYLILNFFSSEIGAHKLCKAIFKKFVFTSDRLKLKKKKKETLIYR
jgi:hypothetical protein